VIGRHQQVLHNSHRCSTSFRANALNTKGFEVEAHNTDGVCDNQFVTARKLLILKIRRDVRVVEGARWKLL
jgi:hypothetical protein